MNMNGCVLQNLIINKRTMCLVDGHHRHQAIKELIAEGKLSNDVNVVVTFVDLSEEEEYETILMIQKNSKRWGEQDFIDTEIKNGNDNYKKFVDFAKSHELTYDTKKNTIRTRFAKALLNNGACNHTAIKSRNLVVTDDQIKLAHVVHDELKDICNILNINGFTFCEAMTAQWFKFREMLPFSDWKKGLKSTKSKIKNLNLTKQQDWESAFSTAYIKAQK